MRAERFIVELDPGSEVVTALNRAIAGLDKPTELTRDIAAVLEQNVNLRFRTKRDPNDQPWPEISQITPLLYFSIDKQRRKQLKHDSDGNLVVPPMPGSLLERTRRMLGSLSSNTGDTWLEVGFGVPYAWYHETGTKRGGEPYMPRRGSLLGDPDVGTLGAIDARDVLDEIDGYMGGLLNT